jgi:hypothetical protein
MSWITRGIEGVATGGLSELAPGRSLGGIGSDILGATGLGPAKQQPGVGGPAADPSKLQQDPATGMYFDPTTGTSYTDATGQSPVTNPNVAQQVAANFATRTSLLGKLGGNQATIDSAIGGQNQLRGSLLNTINNPNASSVAQTQLGIGADAIARQQLQQAAGTTGANAFLARRNAANNIGQLQSTLNGQQALTRANEVDAAQGRLGSVLGAQAQEGQAGYNSNLSGAVAEGNQAGSGQQAQQGMNTKADEESQQNRQKFASGILGAVAGAGTL